MNNFLNPKNIALIGATDRKDSVGLSLAKNLSKKKVFFVNPNRKKVLGKKTYPKVSDIKEKIDLVLIAVPAKLVPLVVDDCVQKRVGGVIIISAGFAEAGNSELQNQVASILKKGNIRFLGPNCMGVLNTEKGLNATFNQRMPKKGRVAFLSQSGALINAFIEKGFGFSKMISLGNSADTDVCDWIEFLNEDQQTKSIAVYIESLKDGKRFLNLKLKKPVIILKGGKTEQGQKVASSHTAALAGQKEIYSAAFKKIGAKEVETLEELLEASFALAFQVQFQGKVGMITNGGALGVLASDFLNDLEVKDIIGTATKRDYEKAIREMISREEIGCLLVAQTLQQMTDEKGNIKAIRKIKKEFPKKPIIACFTNVSQDLISLGIPCVSEIKLACLLINHLMIK